MVAAFSMIAAQRDELFAHRAIDLLFPAQLGMSKNLFHLMTSVKTTSCISALASMNEGLVAPLHGLVSHVGRFGIL